MDDEAAERRAVFDCQYRLATSFSEPVRVPGAEVFQKWDERPACDRRDSSNSACGLGEMDCQRQLAAKLPARKSDSATL